MTPETEWKMKHLKSIATAILLTLPIAAHAQTYTTVPLGNGWSTTTGPEGSYTTVPLGNGWSTTTGPNGYNATTIPLGNGWSTTTVQPQQSQPPYRPYGYR